MDIKLAFGELVLSGTHPDIVPGLIVGFSGEPSYETLIITNDAGQVIQKPAIEVFEAAWGSYLAKSDADQAVNDGLQDVISRLRTSPLTERTPQEIYTQMQGAIDNWTSLAEAKANLREWLPLVAASTAFLVEVVERKLLD